jgi:hypothetical protein
MLEITTAPPNAPVRSAVAVSKLRPEIIIPPYQSTLSQA